MTSYLLKHFNGSISSGEREILDGIGSRGASDPDNAEHFADFKDELIEAARAEFWDGESNQAEWEETLWQDSYKEYEGYIELWKADPLRAAVDTNNLDLIQEQLDGGADISAKNVDGDTPLHHANDALVSEFLIKHGADVNARGADGKTPLHVVSDPKIADQLIRAGADVNAKNVDGDTPLHHANNALVSEFLIENGADVNARGADGKTPLHVVSDPKIADQLIKAGADVNATDAIGKSPLDYAITPSIASQIRAEQADQRAQRAGSLDSLYAALDGPTEPVAPRPPRVRQRC